MGAFGGCCCCLWSYLEYRLLSADVLNIQELINKNHIYTASIQQVPVMHRCPAPCLLHAPPGPRLPPHPAPLSPHSAAQAPQCVCPAFSPAVFTLQWIREGPFAALYTSCSLHIVGAQKMPKKRKFELYQLSKRAGAGSQDHVQLNHTVKKVDAPCSMAV